MILTPAMRLNGRGSRAAQPSPKTVAAGHLYCVEDEGDILEQAMWEAITSSSVANPTVITTAAAHGLRSGQTVTIFGHVGSTPALDGTHVVTVTGATTFTIPVNVTVGGTGGIVAGWVPFSPNPGGLRVLTADPTNPPDLTAWFVQLGTTPTRTLALRFRESGTTRTVASITV